MSSSTTIASRAFLLLALLCTAVPACSPYRIEYHRPRPKYYQKLGADTPDRIVLPDGTILVYAERGETNPFQAHAESNAFRIRYEDDDGNVHLQALLPEHVIANTMNCIRQREYQLLWDEMVAERTKLDYESAGLGYESFEVFCDDNRVELAKMLKRMLLGFVHYEVAVETLPGGTIRCRFWPTVAQLFEFKSVEIVQENFSLKLAVIR